MDEQLQNLLERVGSDPYLADILDQAKSGKISEEEAMSLMNDYAVKHPDLMAQLLTPPEEQNTELVNSLIGSLNPKDGVLASNAALFMPSTDGLPRLNPLMEAAILERLQFDGDIPELRTGVLPKGISPAVSVKTNARNPVALGQMLENASKRIERQVRVQEKERIGSLEDPTLLEAITDQVALVKKSDEEFAVALQGSAETDHPAYRRGQVPDMVPSRRPSGSALARMTPQEKREKAFQFFSTTQGRRSAIPVIRELVAVSLKGEGLEVEERDYDPKAARKSPVAFHEWSVVLGGSGAIQAAFSVIDVAAKVLAGSLAQQMKERKEDIPVILEVTPVNQVDTRTVGWAARLLPQGTYCDNVLLPGALSGPLNEASKEG